MKPKTYYKITKKLSYIQFYNVNSSIGKFQNFDDYSFLFHKNNPYEILYFEFKIFTT